MEIWKYRINTGKDQKYQVIEMPRGAQVLCVQTQYRDQPQVWALVEPDNEVEDRSFVLVGTGWEVEPGLRYIGTFQINQGALVFHLFERRG
jgi:hypothetical protein